MCTSSNEETYVLDLDFVAGSILLDGLEGRAASLLEGGDGILDEVGVVDLGHVRYIDNNLICVL